MSQGLTPGLLTNDLPKYHAPHMRTLGSQSMRLKGTVREVSERRQVGDAEEMLSGDDDTKGAWWKNVGMEEGM